ncbi:otoconin-90 [Spea bombifrons]|uniref:otoconin-90 n=1 Tax=Spea bombifrons TaxID=233779 RepID=UPI00234B5E05|nr:otoconin-90 [Spea bombifrons]
MIIIQLMTLLMILQTETTVAQESGLSPVLPELSDVPLRNINNFTFNGVFKNMDSVTSFLDCLGSHFTWLQNIFTNFPALLNFVSRLKCVTGLCPKVFEDYGCTCRYEMEGLPVDETDSCCFQHRKCYEEALELDCSWDPAKITADVSCLSKNLTCETGDACEKLLCHCDKAAIECLVNAHINSSMKGIDITFCPALVTASPDTTVKNNKMALDAIVQQNRSVDAAYSPTREGELFGFQNDVTTFPSAEETTEGTEAAPQILSTPATGPPEVLCYMRFPDPECTTVYGNSVFRDTVLDSERYILINTKTCRSTTEMCDPDSSVKKYFLYFTATEAASVIGFGTFEMGVTRKSSVTPAGESSSRKIITTPTKTGFKMANESTAHSAASPVNPVTESELHESLERVCDRYHFHQTKEDGNVKAELPLLGEMLFCLTGRCPEEFESYGCYCGQEGKGNPVDTLDSCCFSHQCCIDHLKKLGCQSERNIRSEVVCLDNKPTCVGWSICDKLLCACDKAAAECMAAAPLNETVRSLNRDQCRGETVVCSNGGAQEKPDRAIAAKSESSSSEESSEERSPMREIVGAGHMRKPNTGSPAPRGRRPRSVYLGK